MMYRTLGTAVIVAILATGCVHGLVKMEDADGHFAGWGLPSKVAGTAYIASIDPVEVEASPDWDPDGVTPAPISAADASRIAWIEARLYIPNPDEWEISSVDLRRLQGAKWIYIVTWSPIESDVRELLQIPILLSGRPITLKEVERIEDEEEELSTE